MGNTILNKTHTVEDETKLNNMRDDLKTWIEEETDSNDSRRKLDVIVQESTDDDIKPSPNEQSSHVGQVCEMTPWSATKVVTFTS